MANDLSKIGVAGVLRPPDGNLLTKVGVVAVMRTSSVNELTKLDVVAVLRPSTGYTIVADPGSYDVTGTAALLRRGFILRAYDNLILNSRFSIDTANWAVDGADTTFNAVDGWGVLALGPGASGGFAHAAVSVTIGKMYTLIGKLKASGYLLTADPGSYTQARTDADLSYNSLVVFIEDTDLFDDGATSARVGFKLRTSGVCIETFSDRRLRRDWLPAGESGSDYEVRATKLSGTTPSGDLVNTWLRCNTTRRWDLVRSSTGISTCQLFVEVRSYGGSGAILASGTITMTVEVF